MPDNVYSDSQKAIDEEIAKENAIYIESIRKDSALFSELLKSPGFQKLEEIINKQVSDLVNEMLTTEDDKIALKNRYLARGKKNILDLIYGTINSYKQIKQEEAKNNEKK